MDEYFTYALLFLGILLHGVSYDFYYVTQASMSIKKLPCMPYRRAGLITLCCQGFGSLLGYRLGGVMMEKMFAYQEPVNGLTFNWAGDFRRGDDYHYRRAVRDFFCDPTTKLRLSRSMIAILR